LPAGLRPGAARFLDRSRGRRAGQGHPGFRQLRAERRQLLLVLLIEALALRLFPLGFLQEHLLLLVQRPPLAFQSGQPRPHFFGAMRGLLFGLRP